MTLADKVCYLEAAFPRQVQSAVRAIRIDRKAPSTYAADVVEREEKLWSLGIP